MRLSIVFPTLFLAAGVAATAAPLLQDPRILIDSGGDAIPISSGINEVQPNGNQTVSFDFFNDTSAIVTSFTFKRRLILACRALRLRFSPAPIRAAISWAAIRLTTHRRDISDICFRE